MLLFALAEKIKVGLAECRQKGIRIAGALNVPLMIGNNQIVSVNALGLFGDALEETILVQPFESEFRLVLFFGGHDFHRGRMGQERAHNDPCAAIERMHAQELMRVSVFAFEQTLLLKSSQSHSTAIVATPPEVTS